MPIDFTEPTRAVQHMLDGFLARLPYVLLALLVFLLFYLAGRVLRGALRAFALRRRRRQNLALVLGRLGYGLMLFLGLLVALVIAIPGFTPGQLVNLLGLSSVAIGFAFRDILQNFLAGILLLLNEPFRIGDQIVINGYEGTVEEIQMRATFLTTYDGRRVVIPNSNLFTNSVVVNTAAPSRRLEYDVSIGYSDDIARAKQVMLGAIQGLPEVLPEPPPEALVLQLAGSSINIRLRWWVRPPRQWEALQSIDAVLQTVSGALREAGVDLPFPTQQVLFHDQTEDSDGDRTRQREGWPAGAGRSPRPARIVDALRALARSREPPASSQG